MPLKGHSSSAGGLFEHSPIHKREDAVDVNNILFLEDQSNEFEGQRPSHAESSELEFPAPITPLQQEQLL